MEKITWGIICLFLLVLALFGSLNTRAIGDEFTDSPNRTYIIGTQVFEAGTAMTTQRIMLAARTIKGNDIDAMIIYYKNVDSEWIEIRDNNIFVYTIEKEFFQPGSPQVKIHVKENGELIKADAVLTIDNKIVGTYNEEFKVILIDETEYFRITKVQLTNGQIVNINK